MRLLAEVSVFGEAVVPWSTPRSFQGGKPGKARWWVHEKDKRLIAWQDSLRAAHRKAYGLPPFLGPVMLCTTFYKFTPDQGLWGKRWWTPRPIRGHADRVNLEKGAEDALKTYRVWKGRGKSRVLVLEIPGVFEDDSQTSDGFTRKRWGPEDGIEIRVYAADEEGDDP